MVVKTELCAFSEYRIYPGHGIRFIKVIAIIIIITSLLFIFGSNISSFSLVVYVYISIIDKVVMDESKNIIYNSNVLYYYDDDYD